MNTNFSFSNYLENRQLQEVAEYMTGDDPDIEIRDVDGRNYVAFHKLFGKLLIFQYDWYLNSPKKSTTSFDGEDRNHKGYRVYLPSSEQEPVLPAADDSKKSKLLGSYLAAITKFIKTYKPGTLNFENTFNRVNNDIKKIVPLMQKSLRSIAIKNDMVFLNNKMLNQDALEYLNRKTGIDFEKRLQSDTEYGSDEKENKIRKDRMQMMMDKRSSIQQAKDFMSQQKSEYEAKKKARAARLAPQEPKLEPQTPAKKGFLSRMFGR